MKIRYVFTMCPTDRFDKRRGLFSAYLHHGLFSIFVILPKQKQTVSGIFLGKMGLCQIITAVIGATTTATNTILLPIPRKSVGMKNRQRLWLGVPDVGGYIERTAKFEEQTEKHSQTNSVARDKGKWNIVDHTNFCAPVYCSPLFIVRDEYHLW